MRQIKIQEENILEADESPPRTNFNKQIQRVRLPGTGTPQKLREGSILTSSAFKKNQSLVIEQKCLKNKMVQKLSFRGKSPTFGVLRRTSSNILDVENVYFGGRSAQKNFCAENSKKGDLLQFDLNKEMKKKGEKKKKNPLKTLLLDSPRETNSNKKRQKVRKLAKITLGRDFQSQKYRSPLLRSKNKKSQFEDKRANYKQVSSSLVIEGLNTHMNSSFRSPARPRNLDQSCSRVDKEKLSKSHHKVLQYPQNGVQNSGNKYSKRKYINSRGTSPSRLYATYDNLPQKSFLSPGIDKRQRRSNHFDIINSDKKSARMVR